VSKAPHRFLFQEAGAAFFLGGAMKTILAKVLGWGQLALATVEQVSHGHFPQNKLEWSHLVTSALLALALHAAASTDGTK
jgi:hypothetical protein